MDDEFKDLDAMGMHIEGEDLDEDGIKKGDLLGDDDDSDDIDDDDE